VVHKNGANLISNFIFLLLGLETKGTNTTCNS